MAASGLVSSRRVLGANDRIRIGLIGAGSRGKEIFRAALRCPNVEAAGVADVYTRRLDEVKAVVPETVTMAGANYLSSKMEVPDTMNVSVNQPEKILFTWSSMFSNAYYGETHDYLFGTKGTVMHDESDRVLYTPQSKQKAGGAEEGAGSSEKAPENAGYLDSTSEHMQNFFDCVRSRKAPNCPFEMGFRTAIACQMAIASYRFQRTVRWDSKTEEIL